MKRHLAIVVCCLLCSLIVPAQARRQQPPTASAQPAIVDIRQIDFKNFAYTLEAKSYKLRDGYYAETVAADTQWELGMVDGPYYGDLTGDGKAEVAFVLSYGTAQAPHVAEARVYTLQNGRSVLLATFVVTDAVNCQLDHYLEIEDGMIRIEHVYGKDTRCDHNEVVQYRWNGSRFMPIGAVKRMPCRCM